MVGMQQRVLILAFLLVAHFPYYNDTVNVQISAQYIFSHISRRALDARKYDVSEKMNHYRSNRNTY